MKKNIKIPVPRREQTSYRDNNFSSGIRNVIIEFKYINFI